jgi:MYXO-CTERM domain-containing protein
VKTAAFCFAFLATLSLGRAQVSVYYDRLSFLADSRIASASFSAANFDGFSTGTDLTNATVSGATFATNSSGPLQVIAGSTGVRFAMSPSSGLNVLSPGGSDPSLEDDGLIITFAVPVQAAGMDVVFDVPDGASYVSVTFYDDLNNVLASNGFIPSPSGAPGYQFVGLAADSALIKRIMFTEFDPSANDDNVAYDSLVFTAIPEPASTAGVLALVGLGGAVFWRRRNVGRQAC